MHFLRAGSIYALANVASAAVPFLLLPLLTRVMLPADYAEVVAFALWVGICLPLAGLGVHGALGVAWFSRGKTEMQEFVGTAVTVALCTSIVCALAVATLVALVPSAGMGLDPAWVAVAALTAGSHVALHCRLVLWQSQQKPLHNAAVQIGASALNMTLSLLAVLSLGLGSEGRNGSIAAATAIMAIAALVLLVHGGELRWTLRVSFVRELVAFGLPLVPHALAGVLLANADRWLVGAARGTETLGIYGAAAQLGMVMSVLADAFVKAYNPWLYARLQARNRQDYLCVVGAAYVAVPGFLIACSVLGLMLVVASTAALGPEYREAASLLPWFALGGAFSGIYYSYSPLFFFNSRTGLLATTTVTIAAISLPISWLMVSCFGTVGGAASYACTQLLLAVGAAWVASRTFDLPWGEPRAALVAWLGRVRGYRTEQAT
jgi:O-antigen/teichoic acid export membrane protein